MSHPSWVRGLKLFGSSSQSKANKMSHPSWVRGLKLSQRLDETRLIKVAPLVGAWIETEKLTEKINYQMSHPSWVRGLKLHNGHYKTNINCRTPRGCVD